MPPKPQFTPNISFGNVVQIALLAVGFGGGYAMIEESTSDNEAAIALAKSERGAMELRLRTLEMQQARADERFTSVMQSLARIEGKLERIEKDKNRLER